MLRLDRVIKPWKESAALNAHINLYGFWNDTTFLTKSGDVGMVLRVTGVDYESLDRSEQEYAVKRLESALKAFGPGFHVYQYLFKSNRPDIPFAKYDDPVVDAAIDQRRKFFEAKRDHLYEIEIFYCILLEGPRSKAGVGAALARLFHDPSGGVGELKAQFTNDSMKTLLPTQIEQAVRRLDQQVLAFCRQLADLMQIEVVNQQKQFTFFRRLMNYDGWRIAGRPRSTQFLDYQVVNSDIEAERDHLRIGDHIVRVLTMKEAITETRPLVLDALLKIPGNFQVITEWTPIPADRARKEVNKRRRHFNVSKTGFVSQMGNDATKTNPRDVLVDESKQADIENLGDCLRVLGEGQSLGDFSLTIVLYGHSKADLERLVAECTGVFTNADGNLFAESRPGQWYLACHRTGRPPWRDIGVCIARRRAAGDRAAVRNGQKCVSICVVRIPLLYSGGVSVHGVSGARFARASERRNRDGKDKGKKTDAARFAGVCDLTWTDQERGFLAMAEAWRDQKSRSGRAGKTPRGIGKRPHGVHIGRIGHTDYSRRSGLRLREDAPWAVADGPQRLCAWQHPTPQLGAAIVSDREPDH
jgi:hypothetical protein